MNQTRGCRNQLGQIERQALLEHRTICKSSVDGLVHHVPTRHRVRHAWNLQLFDHVQRCVRLRRHLSQRVAERRTHSSTPVFFQSSPPIATCSTKVGGRDRHIAQRKIAFLRGIPKETRHRPEGVCVWIRLCPLSEYAYWALDEASPWRQLYRHVALHPTCSASNRRVAQTQTQGLQNLRFRGGGDTQGFRKAASQGMVRTTLHLDALALPEGSSHTTSGPNLHPRS
mmetsp:Transcript_56200/g.150060  ORF Transcript_56200/g.150060 Transcript_56200/m.150060 type:complete len:227 (+) Transcript_56200:653-1333(+)